MIKDLKMELLNSEQAKAINGGAPGDGCFVNPCDNAQTERIVYCVDKIIYKPFPKPTNKLTADQNQLSEQSGIISANSIM